MSRSYRHTPISSTSLAKSDKSDKRVSSKKFRRRDKVVLEQCSCVEVCSCIFPLQREVSDTWDMAKDGKHWFRENDPDYTKIMRK